MAHDGAVNAPGVGALIRRTALGGALAVVLTSCGGTEEPAAPPSSTSTPGSASPATSPAPGERPSDRPSDRPSESPTDSPGETPAAEALPPLRDRVSLPALMRESFTGGPIRRGREVLANAAYTRHEVTYPSGRVTVSGVLLRPPGSGPFPAVVLNHGYIEPSTYTSGQGLSREQDYLARAGFVVLHTDYRGHAGSDPASEESRETRIGYTRDTINAVQSLKREPFVDPDRVAMLGRSMGGGVTLNALVVQPGLVRAAVVFAPVSSDFVDNFNRWTLTERPEAAAATYRRHGTPTHDPGFYRGLSSRTYFDRITEPVLIHHGTLDESCPVRWSRTTQRLLRRAGVDSRLEIYRGEQHAFGPQWPLSMERTVGFLRRELRT
jgi:dipeptidyl aminopeptidase/acylaminoacyl peptidase